ncbi:MAG: acyl-CoA carboxylase subunit beta [Planctomycetes bacterium]|nr:acyl-CoA carboxylase subunit beta [Planctomycetota bacterium]
MPVIESRVDPRSDAFRAQREEMLALVAQVRAVEDRVEERSRRAAPKFAARGQLMPRERLQRLLDPGAPFVELSTLAGLGMHDDDGADDAMGGGSIVGVGFVRGVRCLVAAHNSAIKGGAITPMGLKKSLRAQQVAIENRLPAVSLVESAGANLLYQAELFVDGGRVFCNMARMSAMGLPQVTVVHGSSTAGGAYIPGLADYVVMVRDRARVFLAGPPLVKAAIGEDADEEALGGADMHARVSGTAEYLAEDDAHAITIARDVVGALDWDRDLPAAPGPGAPPRYDPDELCGVVPPDPRRPYDVREVIARLVDGSEWLEFKPGYGPQTVCGHARIEGVACGMIGNNGPIFPDGSVKAAQFIQLCCQAGLPLVYLQNTTGYMVGTAAEQAGAVKHGAKMIQAVANATVPQVTLVIGGSYGAGNYGMCGRSFDPRFVFAWPNSRIAVMGGEQVATVMKIITRQKLARAGGEVDEAALDAMSAGLRQQLDQESTATFATARLWDDGVIDPRDSRRVLGFALRTCWEAERRRLRPNTFGVARG